MRRLALLAALLLVAVPVLAPAAASPQPTPVCQFCGGQFEAAAEEAGVNVTVASSEVDVHVQPDGSARWSVMLYLSNGSDPLSSSPARLEAIGRSLTDDGYGLPRDPTYLDARLDGDRVTLQYRSPEPADRHAGLLVVDLLHDGGRQPWYHVNADRFTVHGPEGTVVANTPESGRVDGGAVTWTGSGSGEWYEGTDLHGSPYVVYGPDRAATTRLRASFAVAAATWPIVAGAVRHFLLAQTVLFAVLLGAVVLVVRRYEPAPSVEPLAVAVGLLGVLGLVAPALVHGPEWLTGPPLLALGLAALALSPESRVWLGDPRRQALAVIAVLAVAYPVLVAVHVGLATEWPRPAVIALRATALALPLAAMVPVGAALAHESDRLGWWFALAVVAFAAVPASVVDLADPPSGLGAGVILIALLGLAVAAPLVGSLGLVLGRALARAPRPNAPD